MGPWQFRIFFYYYYMYVSKTYLPSQVLWCHLQKLKHAKSILQSINHSQINNVENHTDCFWNLVLYSRKINWNSLLKLLFLLLHENYKFFIVMTYHFKCLPGYVIRLLSNFLKFTVYTMKLCNIMGWHK